MKKVIFLSAIALAAAVSCSKSEVVDTKFANEAIGFENYLGRDAQTKADVASVESLATGGGIGIYGYYTGDPANAWADKSEANLLQNEHLTSTDDGVTWNYTHTAYWTNDTDEYTFFAYAPYSETAASQPKGKNPQIEYTLPQTLADQVDLVYTKAIENTNVNITKRESVALTFSHALARLSVTANAVKYADGLTFTVTDIAISGPFNTKGTFDLAKGEWLSMTPSEVSYDLTTTTGQLLTEDPYKFSEVEKNYMMMIPTDFSDEKETVDGKEVYKNAAKLTVTYTMTYKGATSKPVTKDVYITTPFEQGNAYVIKLTLQRDEANAIKFSVTSIDGWGTENEVPVS